MGSYFVKIRSKKYWEFKTLFVFYPFSITLYTLPLQSNTMNAIWSG